MIWNDITKVKPEKGIRVIGILVWPGNSDTGVINGELYDMWPDTLIDFQRGRWMTISHWAEVPKDEPKPQLKPGQPGFEWPPCSQCGSTSLRCGCD